MLEWRYGYFSAGPKLLTLTNLKSRHEDWRGKREAPQKMVTHAVKIWWSQ